jgi:hypothetical protein
MGYDEVEDFDGDYGDELTDIEEDINLEDDFNDSEDDSMDGDFASGLASAGWGTDEDYRDGFDELDYEGD